MPGRSPGRGGRRTRPGRPSAPFRRYSCSTRIVRAVPGGSVRWQRQRALIEVSRYRYTGAGIAYNLASVSGAWSPGARHSPGRAVRHRSDRILPVQQKQTQSDHP